MENSARSLEQENLELKEKEHRLTQKILELRVGTGGLNVTDSSDVLSVKSSLSRASTRRSRKSVVQVQQQQNINNEQKTGEAQILTTADVRIVHNQGSGPDDYRKLIIIVRLFLRSFKNDFNHIF